MVEIKFTSKILFVDDEIGIQGLVFKNAIKLILDGIKPDKLANPIDVCIVAEDFEYKANFFDKRVRVIFRPFSKGINDVFSVISYIVPYEYEKIIKEKFTEKELDSKMRLNLLLGLPIKVRINNKPEFSDKYNQIAEREINEFKQLQTNFKKFIKEIIHECLMA